MRFKLILIKSATVYELIEKHESFLDSCLKECMLTNPKLIIVRCF